MVRAYYVILYISCLQDVLVLKCSTVRNHRQHAFGAECANREIWIHIPDIPRHIITAASN